ncbi:hypothetical protein B7494_g1704 [Chlorociboria aeruginascens]|nr:hypothetical protein B7494_g1704 [Chlorociboria aeruginascens]
MASSVSSEYFAAVRAQALGNERKLEAEWIADNNLLVHQDSRKHRKSKAVALAKFTNTLTTVYPALATALAKCPDLDPEEDAFRLFEQTRLGILLQSNINVRGIIYQKVTTEITTNKSLNTEWNTELEMINMVFTYADNYEILANAAMMEDNDKIDTEKECTVREIFNVMDYILDKPETQYAQEIFNLYPAYALAFKRETVTKSDDATYQQEMAAIRYKIKQKREGAGSTNEQQPASGEAGDEDSVDL